MSAPGLADRLAVLGAAVLFSTGGVAIKWTGYDAWQVAGLRAALAAFALWWMVPGPVLLGRRAVLLVGAAQGGSMLLFVLANKATTAANAIFLQATAPLYIPFLASRLLGERATRRDYAAMAAIAVGMALFLLGTETPSATAPNPRLGDALAIASGVTWAGTVVGLRYLAREGAMSGGAAKGALLTGNLMVALAATPVAMPLARGGPSDWAVLAWLGFVQVALSYRLLVRGVAKVPALEASLIAMFEPVLNPIWALLLLGETPSAWAVSGAVVIASVTVARALAGSRAAPGR